MYQVMIVEDDPMVASINCQYVNMDSRFHVAGVFKNGEEGIDYIRLGGPADLVILDYYMPVMDGMEFLNALRNLGGAGKGPEVIMVTAANGAEMVHRLMGNGILDYLVKPFEYARFQQALRHFADYRELMKDGCGLLGQKEIDLALRGRSPAGSEAAPLEKGLQAHTLETIRQCMKADREHFFTSEEIAEQVHLSRVTVRRYMNHMLEAREIVSQVNYQTGGRPSIRYRYGNG